MTGLGRKMRGALLVGVLGFIAPTALAQSIDGLYQPSGADWSCSPDQIGLDGGAVAIQDGVFEGVENRCDLTNPKRDGRGTAFTAICSSEGSTYEQPMTITPTANGVSIQQDGYTSNWSRCGELQRASAANDGAQPSWRYDGRTASIVVGDNWLELSCEPLNASATYLTAKISVPCPKCFTGDISKYSFLVDDQFSQEFEFERLGDDIGSSSGLDYYPNWNDGVVSALMAGSALAIIEYGYTIATFPLTGSSRAIGQLRQKCQ